MLYDEIILKKKHKKGGSKASLSESCKVGLNSQTCNPLN